MRRNPGADHLAHTFTDLMTSLMVIFILLLLVFINNKASVNAVTAQTLTSELQRQLEPQGFRREDIRVDPKDPSTILLAVPDAQLTFQPNSYQLQPAGDEFVRTRMPRLTETLCAVKYRNSIESVVIEGHSDKAPYRGATLAESQARNLRLSQERSMEVVGRTLIALSDQPALRTCLLEKVSASGRGEQDLAETADESRRAVIKIRVNAANAVNLTNAISSENKVTPSPVMTPAVAKILDLLTKLNQPAQRVQFRLTEDEVNPYLTYALWRTPRPGIQSVVVKFFPRNYVSTLTVINFDAIEQWSPGLIPPVFGLTGKKSLWVDFRFSVTDGKITYKIEKAFYQNKALPRYLAEKVIQEIGARQPEAAGGTEVTTPFGLRWLQTGAHYIEGGR